jgi:hypothetical protein
MIPMIFFAIYSNLWPLSSPPRKRAQGPPMRTSRPGFPLSRE